MNRCFLLVIVLIISVQPVFGQSFRDRIRQEVQTGEISEIQALYFEALKAHRPELLPDVYQSLKTRPERCAVPLHTRLRKHWSALTAQQQAELNALYARPELPESLVSPRGLFRIHYTTTGEDAVPLEDLDGSGIPDYVEEAASGMDDVYTIQVDQLSFAPPPDDQNVDGPEWDVYLEDLGSYYGWTLWETQLSEDPDVWTTFMRVNVDFTGFYTEGIDAMLVTLAHEFNHMIQIGYNFQWDDLFMMEATSVWLEEVCYPEVNDYLQYMPDFFSYTNVPFDYDRDLRIYGLGIWFHFLEKRLGGRDIGRRVWEYIVSMPAIPAMDQALRDLGHTFQEELALFYGWNYMTDTRADETTFYPEGSLYPEVAIDDILPFDEDVSLDVGIVPTGAKYFQFNGEDAMVTLIPTNVHLTPQTTSNACVLELVHGTNHPLYTDVGFGLMTRIVTEDEVGWRCVAVVESPGQPTLFIPFAEVKNGVSGIIEGVVWEDTNADGIKDGDENAGIPDVDVDLIGAGEDFAFGTEDDFSLPVETTDAEGVYRFSGLLEGMYRLTVDPLSAPQGYILTTGHDPIEIYLMENDHYTDMNFGFRPLDGERLPASIPNPFNVAEQAEVLIPFEMDVSGNAVITVYHASGYRVLEEDMSFLSEGVQMFRWDGTDERGNGVPGGVYLYVVISDGKLIRQGKLAVVR